jgi:hypothetical protein
MLDTLIALARAAATSGGLLQEVSCIAEQDLDSVGCKVYTGMIPCQEKAVRQH